MLGVEMGFMGMEMGLWAWRWGAGCGNGVLGVEMGCRTIHVLPGCRGEEEASCKGAKETARRGTQDCWAKLGV